MYVSKNKDVNNIYIVVSQTISLLYFSISTKEDKMKDLAIFLSVAVLTWFLTYRIDYVHDFGYMIHLVDRVASGQLPYRDFSLPRTPMFFLVHGLIYKMFGFFGLKAFHCLQSGLIVSLCLRIK